MNRKYFTQFILQMLILCPQIESFFMALETLFLILKYIVYLFQTINQLILVVLISLLIQLSLVQTCSVSLTNATCTCSHIFNSINITNHYPHTHLYPLTSFKHFSTFLILFYFVLTDSSSFSQKGEKIKREEKTEKKTSTKEGKSLKVRNLFFPTLLTQQLLAFLPFHLLFDAASSTIKKPSYVQV